MKCVSYRTFFCALKHAGLKIILDFIPHVCPICIKLPEINREIKEVREGTKKEQDPERTIKILSQKKLDIARHEKSFRYREAR